MKKYNFLILPIALIIIGCSSNNDSGSSASSNFDNTTGQGGSLARFTIFNDYLYTVDNQDLNVFNISNNEQPVQVNEVSIGFNIETLFNYKEYLFIGSQNGMFIYSVDNPEEPQFLSEAQHFTACDPVVSNLTHAFVTLHTNVGCGNNLNQLQIYDVADLENPVLISTRNLTRPIGLGLYNDYLIVCDDEVKIFDISNPESSAFVHSINRDAFDVIIQDNLLILVGDNGVYQYSLDPNNIQNTQELSIINI
ncbi:LVIVD repeat-containing protein [Olleya aquimaris]|uniref:LVIVD repeat-containing protein n=1 Tax=Olleya aquimaris TaxID=639310 RepID=A0A327RJI4_9FLAO|nr:hypothetical protein [Olleya aquimaris]RAJ17089.1 hypothetical protein LY08_00868 [Olleya aquimaris]